MSEARKELAVDEKELEEVAGGVLISHHSLPKTWPREPGKTGIYYAVGKSDAGEAGKGGIDSNLM